MITIAKTMFGFKKFEKQKKIWKPKQWKKLIR